MLKTCIISGGSGFIGTHLVNYLVRKNYFSKIHILDIVPPRISDPSIIFHEYDIRNTIDLNISGRNLTCYHLAALCKEPGYYWDDYFITNYCGTINICDFARKVGIHNIIFTSTMMVFRSGDKRMNEESLTAPDTAYGMSKLLAELILKAWAAENSKNRLRIVRPGVVFGRGDYGNFIRLYNALRRGYFFYIGRDTTIKSSIYVKDVVRFLLFLKEDKSQGVTYNLTFPEPHTIKEICEAFFKTFGFRKRIFTIPYNLALLISYLFEGLDNMGVLKSSIHHRRIQKLYNSTNIAANKMLNNGFRLKYTLLDGLKDWQNECLPMDLH